MLPKDLSKIDKYYLGFLIFLVIMGGMLVFTLKIVFSSVILGFEVDNTATKEAKIDIDKLNEASQWVLNIKKQTFVVPIASPSAAPKSK